MEDKPGINGEEFKITLSSSMFDARTMTTDCYELEVISNPIKHRHQWYWKALHYLTFKTLFYEYCTYEVKIIDEPKLVME